MHPHDYYQNVGSPHHVRPGFQAPGAAGQCEWDHWINRNFPSQPPAWERPDFGATPPAPRRAIPGLGGVPQGGGRVPQRASRAAFGAIPATIELGPSTTRTLTRTRDDIVQAADKVAVQMATAVKIMGFGMAVAGIAIGLGLLLKK